MQQQQQQNYPLKNNLLQARNLFCINFIKLLQIYVGLVQNGFKFLPEV